jgi:hypothetical protein
LDVVQDEFVGVFAGESESGGAERAAGSHILEGGLFVE